jgi:hypothetical protein
MRPRRHVREPHDGRDLARQFLAAVSSAPAHGSKAVGMYGDLQGLVPALPSIERLELPAAEAEVVGA